MALLCPTGAINAPLSALGETELPAGRPLFLYCLRGSRAARAAGILRRRGFGFAFCYALLTFSIGMLSMFGVSLLGQGMTKTALSIAAGLVSSLAIGALFAVAYSVPSQLAAEEEERSGVSNSAMYFAVQGLFSGVATGIGTGLVLNALKGTQSAASGAIRFMTLIAAAGTLLSFVLSYTLPRSMSELGKTEKEPQA